MRAHAARMSVRMSKRAARVWPGLPPPRGNIRFSPTSSSRISPGIPMSRTPTNILSDQRQPMKIATITNTTAMQIVNATVPARILSARDGSFSSMVMTSSHSLASVVTHVADDLL